jgi:hypothetical protein
MSRREGLLREVVWFSWRVFVRPPVLAVGANQENKKPGPGEKSQGSNVRRGANTKGLCLLFWPRDGLDSHLQQGPRTEPSVHMALHRHVGDGVNELKIDIGPGLRVYYGEDAGRLVLLLGGGDKRTQQRDISTSIRLWKQWKQLKKK